MSTNKHYGDNYVYVHVTVYDKYSIADTFE